MFRPGDAEGMSGQRPRWGRVWGVLLPIWVKVNFSEYSILISAPGFIQTLRIGGNEDHPKVFRYFQHSGWPLLTP